MKNLTILHRRSVLSSKQVPCSTCLIVTEWQREIDDRDCRADRDLEGLSAKSQCAKKERNHDGTSPC